MTKHAFLSDGWIEAARAIHAGYLEGRAEPADSPPVSIRMNLVVEQVPFGEGRLDAHVDTTGGVVDVELGHLESADVRVDLDYQTAKAVLVDGDAQAALQAFMTGRIRVEGDMTKLLEFQAVPPGPGQAVVAEQVRAITE